MTAVTVPAKRYTARVFACAVCDGLAESRSTRATTCSTRCRVQLHRRPELADSVRQQCEAQGVRLAQGLEARAARRLRPDLADLLDAGTLPAQAARAAIHAAYLDVVLRVAADVNKNPEIPT
jgi:hypothetical protein